MNNNNNGYRAARIVARHEWNERLFSLSVAVDEGYRFKAGQFASLALPARPEDHAEEPFIARPYSFVNGPEERPLQFLIAKVDGGLLSARLQALKVGDELYINEAMGFLSCDELPPAATLWMLATGTGIAPYLSLLTTATPWQKFAHIVLVHGVRYEHECVYSERLAQLSEQHPGQLTILRCVTRADSGSNIVAGRITSSLADGSLEATAALPLTADSSRVMLCGNPAMIEEVHEMLKARGLQRHRLRKPGHIVMEKYW